MPVFFYIDPEFATDPRMRGVNTLTLRWRVHANHTPAMAVRLNARTATRVAGP
jgi:cytochrome c oxidase assembly protein Cox11